MSRKQRAGLHLKYSPAPQFLTSVLSRCRPFRPCAVVASRLRLRLFSSDIAAAILGGQPCDWRLPSPRSRVKSCLDFLLTFPKKALRKISTGTFAWVYARRIFGAITVYKIVYSDVTEKPETQFKYLKRLVGERGFEPPTPWSRTRCSTRLSHSPTEVSPFILLHVTSQVPCSENPVVAQFALLGSGSV